MKNKNFKKNIKQKQVLLSSHLSVVKSTEYNKINLTTQIIFIHRLKKIAG